MQRCKLEDLKVGDMFFLEVEWKIIATDTYTHYRSRQKRFKCAIVNILDNRTYCGDWPVGESPIVEFELSDKEKGAAE